MVNLIEQATALGVEDNVIWLDKFVPTEDLMMMFKCTSVYLTPFDESTPTSVGVQPPFGTYTSSKQLSMVHILLVMPFVSCTCVEKPQS